MIDLSQYRLEPLRQDLEFVLYRCLHTKAEGSLPSILALSPVMEQPAPATIKKIEHEFSFKDDLNPTWAISPIAFTQQQSRTMLLFEDPNGEPIDQLLKGPMELKQFPGCYKPFREETLLGAISSALALDRQEWETKGRQRKEGG